MTTPSPDPQGGLPNAKPQFDEVGTRDALDSVTQMMVGTKALQDQPGIVYSLAAQQARPQDAQAIDQFMQGLDVEKRVELARAVPGAPEKLIFTPQEKIMLDQLGVNYSDVEYTPQNAATDATHLIMATTGGKYTAKMNKDGTLALDANGQIQRVPTHTTHHSGWFDSWGSFMGHVGGAISTGVGDVVGGMQEGFNLLNTDISKGFDNLKHNVLGIAGGSNPTENAALGSTIASWNTDVQDQQAAGYGTSPWDTLAFYASGKAHTSLTGVNQQFGTDKVDEALKFLANPSAYKEALYGNPANYVTDSYGQTHLTPDAAAKVAWIGSKEFELLARKVNASSATVGNAFANSLGLDPIAHPDAYGYVSGAANIAASFAIDPTMIGLNAIKVAKLTAIGIDSLGDAKGAAQILARPSRLPWIQGVQRGWQRAIDLGEQMRQAHAAGDSVQLASLSAKFASQLPALAPIMGDFVGEHAYLGLHTVEETSNGVTRLVQRPFFGKTDGIRSLDEAAKWVESKQGLNLLQNSRAAQQSGIMPGALSAFGFRKFKGITAGWMTSRSAERMQSAYADAESRLAANPDLADAWKAKGLLTEQDLARFEPHADDAIDAHSGEVLASPDQPEEGNLLPSEQRARYELTASGKGEVVRNLRQTGDALRESSPLGYFSRTAISNRARLAAQRLSTLLPRNTVIDINDPASAEKVYRMAMTYLNRGDAQAIRAAWNVGNPGQRKAIIGGLMDQLGHAAGLGKTATGRDILAKASTAEENYSTAGNNIEVAGERMGLFEGQTRTRWQLPTFSAMQQASRKYGLWEATVGRAMTSRQADMLMSQWKMGALFKPSTVTRNQIEGWLRTILEGRAGDALRAKALATAKNKELWDRGIGADVLDQYMKERGNAEGLLSMVKDGGLSVEQRAEAYDRIRESQRVMKTLESHPIVQHRLAFESGNSKLADEIANGTMLSGPQLGRSVVTHRLADIAPLAAVGRAYRALTFRHMDPEIVDALFTLTPDELAEAMRGYGQQILESDLGFRNAAKQATEITSAGWGASKVRYLLHEAMQGDRDLTEKELAQFQREHGMPGVKWTHKATDGSVGADRYVNALHMRIDAMPATAREAIAHLQDPEHSIHQVVQALEKESKNTAFGKVFFEDPNGDPTSGRWALTHEEAEQGKTDWARFVVDEYAQLLHGANGEFQQELADYITEHGTAPDADWIMEHMQGDARPRAILAPEVMAMPNGGVKGLAQTLQDVEGAAFQWLVERPLQRTTSAPVFLANYAIARKGLNDQVERMVEAGVSREAAENMAKDLATRNAWIKTEQLIDDPGQKTQFDVIARNFFPFARATNAMVRRWGAGLWRNPAAARKMMLAYEGAVHSGLIYNNVYGEPTFTYPGSGVMNMAMRALAEIPAFKNVAAFPLASDMQGGVLMSVPGADNPFRMSMGPMISIPLREVYKHLLPTAWQGSLLKADEIINGPIGAGETFVQLVPTSVRKFWVAMNGDQRNSALASATTGAIANLAAAGLIPSSENSNSEVMQQFHGRVQTQVKNQLFLRAVLGLFAPAAPTTPSEGTSASNADYAWSIEGIHQMSDEYRSILNEAGGDVARANAIFTAMHPDEVVYKDGEHYVFAHASAYETTRSGSPVPGAYLPSTDSALNWMLENKGFIGKYSAVAAYFLPNSTSQDPFSAAAYHTQLELGLRLRKTPQEFLNDVYVKHAESLYYPTLEKFKLEINNAKAAGDTQTADYWTQQKSIWEQEFQASNPLLKAKIDDYGGARNTAAAQLKQLQDMVKNNEVPDGYGTKLQQLLTTYSNYEAFIKQYAGNQKVNVEARANALDMVNRWAQEQLTGTPLADVFNGVFRVLNTNFDRVDGGSP